jgi:DNA-binding CsgD family transcriptional regulator
VVARSRKVRAGGVEVFEVRAAGEDLVVISMPVDPDTDRAHGLTRAEREVAKDVLAGHSSATIARRRGRSPRTIANQLAAIYRKLGVSSRAELAVRLFRGSRI